MGVRIAQSEKDSRLAYLRTLKEILEIHVAILEDAHAPAGEGLPIAEDQVLAAAGGKNNWKTLNGASVDSRQEGMQNIG